MLRASIAVRQFLSVSALPAEDPQERQALVQRESRASADERFNSIFDLLLSLPIILLTVVLACPPRPLSSIST